MSEPSTQYDDAMVERAKRLTHVRPQDRESLWFLGDNLQIILDGSQTNGSMWIALHHTAPGSTPPLHEHDAEDELFFILEGSITFWSVNTEFTGSVGDMVLLPKDVPHTFQSSPETGAKALVITSPSGFEDFVKAVAVPAEYDGPQEGWEMDDATLSKLTTAAEKAGITIIAPPGVRP